ncbi:MAG: efflux RND transporter periplasmic adaptor subunit, partial [Planctomycetota bacterium]
FDARLAVVNVEPGARVRAGETVLASLETAELQLRLAAAKAERIGYLKEADLALRENQAVEVQIAEANRQKVEAQIRLLEYQIAKAALVAPIDGTVVSGDLKRQIGAPVTTGDVLFEVAPLGALRAVLQVPEDRVTDLLAAADETRAGRGTLASVAHPGDYIEFEVEHINPVAEVIDQKNVFEVRVRLFETRPWLRPGMKGIAKVDVGRRSYAFIWTRRLVNWVRMKLWI